MESLNKMTDFKQALEWMKEGKTVVYQDGTKYGMRIKYDPKLGIFQKYVDNELYYIELTLNHFDSISWELYEEEDDWNAFDEMESSFHSDDSWLYEQDLRNLKDLLVKDIINTADITINISGISELKITLGEVTKIFDKRFGF